MRRRRKGEARRVLLQVLSEAYPEAVRFSSLKQRLEEQLGGPVSNNLIYDNLRKLEREGQVERMEDGWREIRLYSESRVRDFLRRMADDPQPLNIDWTGHSLTPCIEVGYEKGSAGPPQGLELSARERFGLEVRRLLAGMGERERGAVMDFFASALWLGYRFFSPHLPGEAGFKTPVELFESKVGDEVGKHYLAEYISQGTRDHFRGKLSIAEYKLLLLAYALLDQIRDSVARTPVSDDANRRRMSRSRPVLDFLKAVDGIRFAYVVAVGYDGLDEEMIGLARLQRLEGWLRRLGEHGERDLRVVAEAMKKAMECVGRGRPPGEDPLPFHLTPKDIYDLHPRGKNPGLYLGILGMILGELKARGKLPGGGPSGAS